MNEKAGGPAWGSGKRALGKMSRDWLFEWPGRDEDDLEREMEEEEEERARDLQTRDKERPPVRNAFNTKQQNVIINHNVNWLLFFLWTFWTVLNGKTC